MKKSKSHFKFTNQERSGIFFLIVLIIVLQGVYFVVKLNSHSRQESSFLLNEEVQRQIDSLKEKTFEKGPAKRYPFNPNYISDHKGYTLGMTPEQIDRLHTYRGQNRYVNSVQEFQEVTGVSDAWLEENSPLFKFPDWTNKKASRSGAGSASQSKVKMKAAKKDLNLATAEELKVVYGIGDVLATRIVKFRDQLGGFLVDEQLNDVYALDPDVVKRVLKKYAVLNPPKIKKINLNSASLEEIASLVYIKYDLAAEIISYRQVNGRINSFDELKGIPGFPKEKIERIELYLSL